MSQPGDLPIADLSVQETMSGVSTVNAPADERIKTATSTAFTVAVQVSTTDTEDEGPMQGPLAKHDPLTFERSQAEKSVHPRNQADLASAAGASDADGPWQGPLTSDGKRGDE